MSFASFIEKRRAHKQYRQDVRLLLSLIGAHSEKNVRMQYALLRNNALYTRADEAKILRAAIAQDNVALFNLIFQRLEKKDYFFVKSSSAVHPRGAIVTDREHVLHAAIDAGAHNIALCLAQSPDVIVGLVLAGSSQIAGGYYHRVPFKQNFGVNQIAAIARAKGMEDVAAVIDRRTHALRPKQGPKP